MPSILKMSVLSLLLPAAYVHALGNMKPGLWEMTMQLDPAMAESMKKMPKLSPEQIVQMNKMGIKMPQMQGGAMVHKVCITKEMAERDQPPAVPKEHESVCKPQNFNKTSSGYSVDIVCDSPDLKGTGTAKGTFASSESFTSVYDFKGVAHGKPVNSHHETSAKWTGSDCGDVKPYSEMMQKKAEGMKK
ncbi:MAG: DUF3617 domain-containing protein [Pseudomonadota bacterium]